LNLRDALTGCCPHSEIEVKSRLAEEPIGQPRGKGNLTAEPFLLFEYFNGAVEVPLPRQETGLWNEARLQALSIAERTADLGLFLMESAGLAEVSLPRENDSLVAESRLIADQVSVVAGDARLNLCALQRCCEITDREVSPRLIPQTPAQAFFVPQLAAKGLFFQVEGESLSRLFEIDAENALISQAAAEGNPVSGGSANLLLLLE
jgi:hypothetical protein